MRRYETIVIVDPDVSPEAKAPFMERCGEIIDQHNGMTVNVDEWGARKLAYEIKKKNRGHYVLFDYCGEGDLVKELERFFRIDDRVLKYLTIVLEKEVDLDQVKREMEEAEAKKAASEQEATESAESSDEPENISQDESESAEPEPEDESQEEE